ncbi:MAG: extracellular solute-binding protein [Defluviitaleaceae bacterium]|nr:extracellular solute-binding protein [Defluviitaleaceae bacterium]
MRQFLLLAIILLIVLVGCSREEDLTTTITVVTSFGHHDGTLVFTEAYTAFEEATGYTVNHVWAEVINEEWKAQVVKDFHGGNIPDVLFFFTGADADELVLNNYFVPISEIRAEFPDFASNMRDSLLPVSPADGRQYSVPVNGFWQGLFVNLRVLESSGVDFPGGDYTWAQFLLDSQAILDAGYTPIALSLYEIPHYWFEFAIFNNGGMTNHLSLPRYAGDDISMAWADGLRDIQYLYNRGFLPVNTLTATDHETGMLMIEHQAAFMVDGSWKMGWFERYAENIDDFAVTFVPAREARDPRDIIGGLSMGYYITRSAWNDPARRQASVEFVMALTTDEVIASFGTLAITALEDGVMPPENANAFTRSAIEMTRNTTGVVAAVQDKLPTQVRRTLFEYIPYVVTGIMTPEEAINSSLGLH